MSCRKRVLFVSKVVVLHLPEPGVAFIRATIQGAKGERPMMTVEIAPVRLLIGQD